MNLKISFFLVLILGAGPGNASDQFGAFHQYADNASMKPFTRDLGGVLGSAAFHSGRSLGLTGFDVGVHGGMQFTPAKDDQILRQSGVKAFGLPWVQAEIGMPFRVEGFIRGISYQGLTISGGGLRYSLLPVVDQPWAPQVLVSGVGHSVVHQDFSASHFGFNVVLSLWNPRVTPYVAGGFDRTRLVVRAADNDVTLIGKAITTLESRFTAGFAARPFSEMSQFRFFYLQAAFILAHGAPGADMGLGIRF